MLYVAVLRCVSGISSTPVIILVFTKLTTPEVFEDSTNPLRNAKSKLTLRLNSNQIDCERFSLTFNSAELAEELNTAVRIINKTATATPVKPNPLPERYIFVSYYLTLTADPKRS